MHELLNQLRHYDHRQFSPKRKSNPGYRQSIAYSGLTAYNDRPTPKKQEDLKKKHAQEFSGPLVMRKIAVPAEQCEDQTAFYMGDPPKDRSALGELIAREIQKQAQESCE